MSFPLFRRPGTIVFLDDDPDYLEMLALVLPRHWHVRLFMRPAACVDYLVQESPFWAADAWNQQQIVAQWRDGKPLIPQILGYWSKYTERFALGRVCVADYSMPGMDGLQFLGELSDWPGARVLLTGQADEQVAVKAFNQGLINQFITKQAPDISRRLIAAVENLLNTHDNRQAQAWSATLSPQQIALLRDPSVSRTLQEFVSQRWIEHVLIGDPFGVLGMNADGEVGWLQLEPTSALQDLAELAQAEGRAAAEINDLRQGRRLIDLELRQAVGATERAELATAFSIGDTGELRGALFPVRSALCPDASRSYSHWLARQERRAVLG